MNKKRLPPQKEAGVFLEVERGRTAGSLGRDEEEGSAGMFGMWEVRETSASFLSSLVTSFLVLDFSLLAGMLLHIQKCPPFQNNFTVDIIS